ncbi:MAG: hypothetical protein HY290_08415 [Planctomycetia bacterium]|nr:hypothetical protein [Planctomycetia bacterium]
MVAELSYRVIGIGSNGTREVCATNVGIETAEAIRHALLESRRYVSVLIEQQSQEPPGSHAAS